MLNSSNMIDSDIYLIFYFNPKMTDMSGQHINTLL